MAYAVVFCYSFDNDCVVTEFESEHEATNYLRKAYSEELRIDKEENDYVVKSEISSDGYTATITDCFQDHEDITYFHVAHIGQPSKYYDKVKL